MVGIRNPVRGILSVLALGALLACGSPVSIEALPVYPGATEHKVGESGLGNALAGNMQADSSMRSAVGIGGKTEQKAYRLPAGAGWTEVKRFYDDKLAAGGWSSGMGDGKSSAILDAVNASNPLAQTGMWSRGEQTLSINLLGSPMMQGEKELIVSLSTR